MRKKTVAAVIFVAFVLGSAPPEPPPAKSITLHHESTTLPAALKALAEQTGIVVHAETRGVKPPFRLYLDRQTFWQALDQIGAASATHVSFGKSGNDLTLVD